MLRGASVFLLYIMDSISSCGKNKSPNKWEIFEAEKLLIQCVENFLYSLGEMFVLERVYLLGNIVGCVGGEHRAGSLEECCAFVVVAIDKVNGYTALTLFCSNNSLVYAVAIHSFAAIFGQQGRVYVHDASGISIDELLGNKE